VSQVALAFELFNQSVDMDNLEKHNNLKCRICRKKDEFEMLICDDCENGFHMHCLRPKLVEIPRGDWFCGGCLKKQAATREQNRRNVSGGKRTKKKKGFYRDKGSDEEESSSEEEQSEEEESEENGSEEEAAGGSDAEEGSDVSGSEEEEEEEEGSDAEEEDSDEDSDAESVDSLDLGGGESGDKRKSAVFASSTRGGQGEVDMKICFHIWKKLRDQDSDSIFLQPVDVVTEAPDYLDHIERPMDLRTIKENIDSNQYSHHAEFAADVRLMLKNCITYSATWEGGEAYAERAVAMEKLFKKNYERRFPSAAGGGSGAASADPARPPAKRRRSNESAAADDAGDEEDAAESGGESESDEDEVEDEHEMDTTSVGA
jgi:hypothetical protein